MQEMLIFEHSRSGRRAQAQAPASPVDTPDIPGKLLRRDRPLLPEVSELQAVRHYTQLSQKNFSIEWAKAPVWSYRIATSNQERSIRSASCTIRSSSIMPQQDSYCILVVSSLR